LFILEKRGHKGHLIVAFQYLKGAYKKERERLFTEACSDRTRDNSFKLEGAKFRLDIRKKFFMTTVVRHWSKLPREAVGVPSSELFKVKLDSVLSNQI